MIKKLGEKKYKELILNKKPSSKIKKNKDKINLNSNEIEIKKDHSKENFYDPKISDVSGEEDFLTVDSFMEIAPLDYEIDNATQKDLSSIPISEIDFPKTVFIIVDNKIELETKYLKDYADWQFLSKDELNRRTIEIFEDLKNAKRFCSKEQKVIKVPNADVFKIVAPLLVSRGISRIVSEDKLIAL